MAQGAGGARSGEILRDAALALDVALAVALGGDCPADVGMLRAEPGVFVPPGPTSGSRPGDGERSTRRLVKAGEPTGPRA